MCVLVRRQELCLAVVNESLIFSTSFIHIHGRRCMLRQKQQSSDDKTLQGRCIVLMFNAERRDGNFKKRGKTLVRPGNAAVTGQRGYRTLAHKVPALFSTSITSISLRRAVSTDCAEREGSLRKQGRDVYAGDEHQEPPPSFLGPLSTLQGRVTSEQRKRRAQGGGGGGCEWRGRGRWGTEGARRARRGSFRSPCSPVDREWPQEGRTVALASGNSTACVRWSTRALCSRCWLSTPLPSPAFASPLEAISSHPPPPIPPSSSPSTTPTALQGAYSTCWRDGAEKVAARLGYYCSFGFVPFPFPLMLLLSTTGKTPAIWPRAVTIALSLYCLHASPFSLSHNKGECNAHYRFCCRHSC